VTLYDKKYPKFDEILNLTTEINHGRLGVTCNNSAKCFMRQ